MTLTPQTTFPVAAGIGPFRPSFASEYSLIAGIYFATDVTSFLSNPQRVIPMNSVQQVTTPCTFIESQKHSKACSASYFVPGGLELISPWPSKNVDDWHADVYVVDNIRGYHLDYSQMSVDARFDGISDCKTFGNSKGGIQICLSSQGNTLNAKFVHCPLDLASSSACETDTTWHASTGWSTSLQPYIRTATTAFDRANSSILSISHSTFSAPQPAQIRPQDLLDVYTASFNGSGLSFGTGSSQQFIQYLSNVLIFAETSSSSYNSAGMYLRNLLALPLYYFHNNNLAPSILLSPDKPLPGLPSELYSTASLATTSFRIVVGRATVIVYIVLGSLVLLACLAVVVLGSISYTAGKCPETTVWPVLDFVANCKMKEGRGEETGEVKERVEADARGLRDEERVDGLVSILKECRGLGDRREVRERIKVGVVLDDPRRV